MKTKRQDKPMTQVAQLADPTREPRGFIRTKPKTRHLRRHVQRTYSGNRTIGITPCEVIAPDGSRHTFTKSRGKITHTQVIVPTVTVRVRHRVLRGTISDYIAVAERVGLNAKSVATEYRYRRDNGYPISTDVAIESNATFRGGDA